MAIASSRPTMAKRPCVDSSERQDLGGHPLMLPSLASQTIAKPLDIADLECAVDRARVKLLY